MKTSSGENRTKVPLYRQRRFISVLILVVVVASALTVTNYALHFFNNPLDCGSTTPVSTRFAVLIDFVPRPLPSINVTQGETITIHAWNNSSFTRGFGIQHYFDQGTYVQPGQSCDLTFTVSQPGTFLVYSTMPDPTIDLAELNVSPMLARTLPLP